MSIRHPVDTHLAKQKRRARRRVAVDVLFVLIFLCAIAAIVIVHVKTKQFDERRKHDAARDIANAIAEERRTYAEVTAREEAGMTKREAGGHVSNEAVSLDASTTTALTTPESPLTPQEVSSAASPSIAGVSLAQESVLGFVRFEDVTATRYENMRIGFVMEIPLGWGEVYARSEDVVLASSAHPPNASIHDVVKKKDSMWIRVVRPCASTVATSTLFVFSTSTDTSIREAAACVQPFLVTLGYRADANDYLGREQFLLSIGRTLYPIVQSVPPYLPIR